MESAPVTNASGNFSADARDTLLQMLVPAYFYYPPVLLLLGLLGNTLSFLVFSRIAPGTSVSTHFRSLAVTDTIYAGTYLLPLWLTRTFGIPVREASDLWCKLLTFINYSAGDVSMWLVVAMAVDRCVGIMRPFLARRFSNSRTALATLGGLVVLSAIKNFSVPIAFGVSGERRSCTYQSMTYYHATVRYWIALTFAGLLPVLAVFSISCVIGCTLCRHRRLQERLIAAPDAPRARASGRERTAIVLVFANSVTFLVTVLPTFINNALRIFLDRRTLEVMQVFTVLLLYCNHCLGFYVYCLSSAEYRRKVCLVLRHTLRLRAARDAHALALFSVTERHSDYMTLRKQHVKADVTYMHTQSERDEPACTRIPLVTFTQDRCCAD